MTKKRKDLPAKADINRNTEDEQVRNQEEFDNKGHDGPGSKSEVKSRRETESLRDSQQGDERMLPETKKKQSPGDYREDRKLPQIKK
jgi:hypothetical protein